MIAPPFYFNLLFYNTIKNYLSNFIPFFFFDKYFVFLSINMVVEKTKNVRQKLRIFFGI